MKVLVFSDVHWSTYSSIIRQRQNKYSIRLEHLIDSMNWIEDVSKKYNCERVYCLGDFFDKPTLNDEELTALQNIKWNDIYHFFIVGNHESSVNELTFNSTQALESERRKIISEQNYSEVIDKTQIHFVPYIVERERLDLSCYLNKDESCTKHIVLSHNDIAGINYGGFISKSGFTIDDISANCDLYLNGHLHNTEFVTKKILNVGSLSAHNFTNDSFKYKYGAWIVDTETLECEFIENPHGFRFYKLEISNKNDMLMFNILDINSVLTIKCAESIIKDLTNFLQTSIINNIVSYKIITARDAAQSESNNQQLENLSIEHLEKFKEFCLNTIGTSNIVLQEIEAICK